MAQKILGSQTDFSYGEVDPDLKRNDSHPARKGGLRQMSNARIHNSGTIQNRSGRSALFPASGAGRIEEITMSPGNDFKMAFRAGAMDVINSAGTVCASFTLQNQTGGSVTALPWTLPTVGQIVHAILGLSIYLTFPGMPPQVLSWDGVTVAGGWTLFNFSELVISNQKRAFFYRISPQGIALLPGAQTGTGVSLVASAPLFVAGHVGTRMRFINRQMLITAVTDSLNAVVTIEESLPGTQTATLAADPRTAMSIGDVIIGNTSGSKGIVTALSAGGISIQLISTNATQVTLNFFDQRTVSFVNGETAAGPGGSIVLTSVSAIISPTIGVSLWDEEVMNAFRGYPASVFVDQYRLGFCDFPSVPNGIGWSAINSPTDCYVGGATLPNSAIFELAPNKVRIYYVVPGPEGSEFIFADKSVSYIPISETNPLRSGSVAFKKLSGDGAARVQPRLAQEAIVYVNAGGNSPMAVIATGAYLRPFNTKSLSDYHNHLFNNIQAIACPSADATFNERYAYILNGDGSIVVGKYKAESLAGNEPVIGWGPWSGAGSVKWISAYGQDVLFTTSYFGATICEILNDAVFMDASLFVNALPTAFAAPVGKGPLWWIPSQSVFLMDQTTRPMGTYQIDANGNIVPQNNGGENLGLASLVAGQIWTGAAEPFAPDAQAGSDIGQRMNRRQISYFGAYVIHSTGFILRGLFSGKQTRLSPHALGDTMNEERFPAYNTNDDTALPPIQRETAEFIRPPGSTYDPRAAAVWDTPGPFQLLEFAIEVTV